MIFRILLTLVAVVVIATWAVNRIKADPVAGPVIDRIADALAPSGDDSEHRNDEHCGPRDGVVTVVLDDDRYPLTTDHIQDLKGECNLMRWDPGPKGKRADKRRRAAFAAWKRRGGGPCPPNWDKDEWRPAGSTSGGAGAYIRCVPRGDNRGAGSVMGNQLEDHHGELFRVDVR